MQGKTGCLGERVFEKRHQAYSHIKHQHFIALDSEVSLESRHKRWPNLVSNLKCIFHTVQW